MSLLFLYLFIIIQQLFLLFVFVLLHEEHIETHKIQQQITIKFFLCLF